MRHKETILFAVLIGVANVPLIFGVFPDTLSYVPEKVMQGQWWRLATHAFVHVSWYHLLLDGAAFFMLYAQLAEQRLARRLAYLVGIHTAVVTAVTMSLPSVRAIGYCGLSGIAHGLMALWCLERIVIFGGTQTDPVEKTERLVAIGVFTGLLAKSVYEVAVGHVFFKSTHLGYVGVPVVVSHLAGVIGAMVMYAILNAVRLMSFCRMIRKQQLIHVMEILK